MPVDTALLADTPDTLAGALALLEDLPVVGIDVERADWDRYYRAAALIQVGGAGRVALVDPLALDDLSPLAEFLASRVTVLHALENDLGPLETAGVIPAAVEDTAIAAAVLGMATGLEGLLRDVLGVDLDADKAAMQRADWEARPLSAQMLSYAAGDVADLPALWAALADRLEASGRTSWYRQELTALLAQPSVQERREWTRTKGIGRLEPAARARVRALWEAREELARRTNTAPARIVGDKVLVNLAIDPPRGTSELGRRGMRRAAVRLYGAELLQVLRAATPAASTSRPRGVRVATEADRALADRLRDLRAQRAAALGIDAGVLCPSRTLLAAVLTNPASPDQLRAALGLRDWQWEQLGGLFCQALGLDGQGTPDGQVVTGEQEPTPMADVLNPDALHHELDRLPGWEGTQQGIVKVFRHDDDAEATRFVGRVTELADQANHHPHTEVSGGDVTLTLVTHSAGGVTQRDIQLARDIDRLAANKEDGGAVAAP